jgi:ribosomal protein L32E
MNIIYKITYIPHLNTDYPKYYIGSKYNYTGNYFGSVSSAQEFDYTEGLSLKDWWKNRNKDDFIFEIIQDCGDVDTKKLVKIERDIHKKLNVLSDDFFNSSIATLGWVSVKKSEKTKEKMSEKTKEFWESELGKQKKKRLIERNEKHSSKRLKEKWQDPEFREKMKNRNVGQKKGCKFTNRKPRKVRKCYIEGKIYDDAKIAAKHYEIDVVNVRRRCRLEQYEDWYYI